jgi:amino acid transporter
MLYNNLADPGDTIQLRSMIQDRSMAPPDIAIDERTRPGETPPARLSRSLSASRLVFLILSATTPLSGVVGLMPLSFAFGSGAGVPLSFAGITLLLMVFSVGYIAMSRESPGAGSFYSFIARGFGVVVGLGAAYVAVLSYIGLYCATLSYLGFYAAAMIADYSGFQVPWFAPTFLAATIISALGRRRIDLNSKILGLIVFGEFLMVMALDFAIFGRFGGAAFPAQALSWSLGAGGGAGVSLMLAFTCYMGFEAATLFSEEAVQPERNVAIATFGSVLLIGLLFGVTAWLTVGAIGVAAIQETARAQTGEMYIILSGRIMGPFAGSLARLLMTSSLFAAALAGHNVCSRYLLVLGRQHGLPTALGRVHPRHGSPHVASLTVTVIAVAAIGSCFWMGIDPITGLGAAAIGVATLGIILLQALTSLAVIAYFRRRSRLTWWRTGLAPLSGFAGLAIVFCLAIAHFDLLSGASNLWTAAIPFILAPVFLAGMIYAAWLRRSRPAIFRNLAP